MFYFSHNVITTTSKSRGLFFASRVKSEVESQEKLRKSFEFGTQKGAAFVFLTTIIVDLINVINAIPILWPLNHKKNYSKVLK